MANIESFDRNEPFGTEIDSVEECLNAVGRSLVFNNLTSRYSSPKEPPACLSQVYASVSNPCNTDMDDCDRWLSLLPNSTFCAESDANKNHDAPWALTTETPAPAVALLMLKPYQDSAPRTTTQRDVPTAKPLRPLHVYELHDWL